MWLSGPLLRMDRRLRLRPLGPRRGQNEHVLRTAELALLQHLKARPGTKADTAVQTCKRAAPELPRRLRPAKPARVMVVREQEADLQLGDLLQWREGARCTAEQARDLVWQGPEPEAGLHFLSPAGPWPAAGSQQTRNGRLFWVWQCTRCPCARLTRAGLLSCCGNLAGEA